MGILFHSAGIDFQLAKPRTTITWIKAVIRKEKRKLGSLAYIFCTDEYLLSLNRQYLKHKTLTDILTFDYSDNPSVMRGEIYVSIDRVRDNAIRFSEPFEKELHRVLIHGVLHLAGHKDKTTSEKAKMREKEEAYLSLR